MIEDLTGAIEITQRIEAPPEIVFAYLTDSRRFVKWMGVGAELDPRPGGRYRIDVDGEQADLSRFEAIINSMTPGERLNPQIINGSRRTRIARGSGTTAQDVNRLLRQYAQLRKMMRGLKGLEGKMKKGGIPGWRSISG